MKWWLALHVISVISWMAGLLYLPRLFVYHARTSVRAVRDQFKVMEHKLYYYIMVPALVLTVISGGAMMLLYLRMSHTIHLWFVAKLSLAGLLLLFHGACGWHLKQFKQNLNPFSHRYFRAFNEIPTLLMIGIVILVVVQP